MSSPRILAIDTTGEFGSLALLEADGVIEEVTLHAPDGFSPVIFGELQSLLDRHALTLETIDVFAAASGPGSFTGVRVGLTVVKGLAEAVGRKVVAVSNLAALSSFGTRELRAAVVDARRGEVYGAVYDAVGRLVQGETVCSFKQWMAGLPEGDLEIVTGGFALPLPESESLGHPHVAAPRNLAALVGRIAASRHAQGQLADPLEIDANYVRRSDAELLWRES